MQQFEFVPFDSTNKSFSSRQNGCDNNLFEAVSLAALKRSGAAFNNADLSSLHINSFMQNKELYLSINKYLWFFANINDPKLDFQLELDAIVDKFLIFDSYVLVALRNGSINVIDIKGKKVVALCCVQENRLLGEQYFVALFSYKTCEKQHQEEFILVNNNGTLHSVTLNNSNVNIECASSFVADLNMTVELVADCSNKVLVYGSKIALFDLITLEKEFLNCSKTCVLKFKKIYRHHNMSFIALKDNGSLCLICARTLLVKNIVNRCEMFENLIFQRQEKSAMLYVCCTKQTETPKDYTCKMLKFPELNEVFSVHVENIIHLVNSNDINDEQLYLSSNENNEIRVNCIMETEPKQKLERLIRKLKFSEAEAFAKKFNLDTEIIKKARVEICVQKGFCQDSDIEEILALMKDIKDENFIITNCLKIKSDYAESICKVLHFASSLSNPGVDQTQGSIFAKLHETRRKFNIFVSLGKEFSMNSWNKFRKNNLFAYFIMQMREQKYNSAKIVFLALEKSDLELKKLKDVLRYLTHLPIDLLRTFFNIISQKFLFLYPQTLPSFVDWTVKRIFLYEDQKREIEFPETASSFLADVLNVFRGDFMECIDFRLHHVNLKDEYEKLESLNKSLEAINSLKNNFNIYLTLQTCTGGPGSILQHLLDINVTSIDTLLEKFLIPFMVQNGLNPDLVLQVEIENFIKLDEKFWHKSVPLIWTAINSIKIRIELLLKILKTASKPWCAEIRSILEVGLKFAHPLVKAVEKEARNEPKFVVLQRYNMTVEEIDELDYDDFIFRAIIKASKPTVVEDLYTLCSSERHKSLINVLIIKDFVAKGKVWDIFELINKQTSNEVFSYIHTILSFYEKNLDFLNKTEIEIFVSVLSLLIKKALETADEFERKSLKEQLQKYKSSEAVTAAFNTKITFSKLSSKEYQKTALKTITSNICKEIISESNINVKFKEILKKATVLASFFDHNVEQILLSFCVETGDVNLMYLTAQYAEIHCNESQLLCQLAVLILRSVRTERIDLSNTLLDGTFISEQIKEVDTKLLNACLNVARWLSVKAVQMEEVFCEALDVFDWCHIEVFLSTSTAPGTKAKNNNVSTISEICNIFNLYCNYLVSLKGHNEMDNVLVSFLKIEDPLTNDDFNFVGKQLTAAMENICREGNYRAAINLVNVFEMSFDPCEYASLNKLFNRLVLKCTDLLIGKLTNAPTLDANQIFELLLGYPTKKAYQRIHEGMRAYKQNLPKFETFVKVGGRLFKYSGADDEQLQAISKRIRSYKSIPNCSINFLDFSKTAPKELLFKLIANNEIDLVGIQTFCGEHHLNVQVYYVDYLRMIIENWKPLYKISDASGKRCLKIENDESELFDTCMHVSKLITSREAILDCIDAQWNTVNFYYYEVLITILKIGAQLDVVSHFHYQYVLTFFKYYTRISKPSGMEIDEWFKRSQKLGGDIEPLSEFRLPFITQLISSKDIWKILRSELNLKNYLEWFDVSVCLKDSLSNDEICSCVVKDASTAISMKSDQSEEWNLYPKYKDLFLEIDDCLAHIKNPLTAASMANSLISKTNNGADRLAAYHLAYKYDLNYRNSGDVDSSGDARSIKLKRTYHNYSVSFILHSHNLADREYINSCESPKELIELLYMDSRIIKAGNRFLTKCPDINTAVDAIAELHEIDVRAKRLELLTRWFYDSIGNNFSADSSFRLSLGSDEVSDDCQDCILRAAYMCMADVEFFRTYVHERVVKNQFGHLTYARFVELYSLIMADPKTDDNKQEYSYKAYLDASRKYFLLHNIQTIGYTLNYDMLEKIPKEKILKKLARDPNNSLNIKVMASICKIYHIFDLKHWEIIMNGMVNLKMIDELKSCLHVFLDSDIKVGHKFYALAWQTVIDDAFRSTLQEKDGNISSYYLQILFYLQTCPLVLINHLNLSCSQEFCIQMKKFDLAALLIKYVPESQRQKRLEDILYYVNAEELRKNVQHLSQYGFVGLDNVLELLNTVKV